MSDANTIGNTTIQPLDAAVKHDSTVAPSDSAPTTNGTAAPVGSTSDANATATSSQQNALASLANAKDAVVNCELSDFRIRDHDQYQQQSDRARSQERLGSFNTWDGPFRHVNLTLTTGPVAQNVQAEASKTGDEFKDLANSRQTPETTAANGQKLTNYHSFFYRLLSWQNPRATGITFAANILLIFLARYMNILSYFFKFSFIILGVTSGLEVAGKVLFDDGLASKMRPRKYWTIPRESLERMTEDVEQLINFFVIEIQRILYAENVYATLAVFSAAFLSYWLIKLVPFWGLTLISTIVTYLTPLVYIKNREAIDNGLNHAGEVIGSQASQIKKMTAEKTNNASKTVQSYAGEYSSKAQEYMGAKKQQVSASASNASESLKSSNTTSSTSFTSSSTTVNSNDFPAAPQQAPSSTGTTGSLAQSSPDPLLSH